MKRQIRQGVFETNSSSTHAICIATEDIEYDFPYRMEFNFGYFGWEVDKLTSKQERARYLYTCLAYVRDIEKIKEYIKFIADTLHKHGVEDIYFDDFKLVVFDYQGEIRTYLSPSNDCYVDHGDEAVDFVEAVCSDEKLLLNYLFSDNSFILTGNDNDDTDVDIKVDYPHEEFYKWN
jgi:hypothetical protein